MTGGEDHKVNLWAIGKPNAILVLFSTVVVVFELVVLSFVEVDCVCYF